MPGTLAGIVLQGYARLPRDCDKSVMPLTTRQFVAVVRHFHAGLDSHMRVTVK
jgi:hypothetical protein